MASTSLSVFQEAFVPPDVAGGAHEALSMERFIERGIGDGGGGASDVWLLLGERSVARQAEPCGLGIGLPHLDELPHDTGAHAPGVQARAPVPELGRMTGAAAPRGE